MVHRAAVDDHGLPPAHFFIWSDDPEYLGGILRESTGYMVPESIVWHWTPEPYDTLTDTRDRFYYRTRNHLWQLRPERASGASSGCLAWASLRSIRTYVRAARTGRARCARRARRSRRPAEAAE